MWESVSSFSSRISVLPILAYCLLDAQSHFLFYTSCDISWILLWALQAQWPGRTVHLAVLLPSPELAAGLEHLTIIRTGPVGKVLTWMVSGTKKTTKYSAGGWWLGFPSPLSFGDSEIISLLAYPVLCASLLWLLKLCEYLPSEQLISWFVRNTGKVLT